MEKVKNVLATIIAWVKSHVKLVAIIAAVIIVAIIVISFITGGPKRAVKSYISAMNKGDLDKLVKTMDLKAAMAWDECDGEEDDFKDAYDDIDEDDDDVKEQLESAEEGLEYLLDSIDDNYDKYSIKVKKIKDVEKLDSGLYKVKAQIETKTEDKDGDEDEKTNTTTFIVYNNKVVTME